MRSKDENKRQAIYNAALEMTSTEGLSAVSMAKIARRANVSSSTIYVYFDNKADMLDKLYFMVKKKFSAHVFQDIYPDTAVKDGLELFIRRAFYFYIKYPLYLSFHEQFGNSPQVSPEIRQQALALFAPALELCKQGYEQKLLRAAPKQLTTILVNASIISLAHSHLSRELLVDEELLTEFVAMLWQAIKA